jgi:hypothetical protein
MANFETTQRIDTASGTCVLRPGPLTAAAIAVCLAQVALAIPAVLNDMLRDFGFTLGPAIVGVVAHD